MEVGIIGLPQSGKTTVFNAVTHGKAATGYGAGAEPNVGVVKVPDQRLWRLSELFHPKKTTPADIVYVDFPAGGAAFGPGGTGPGSRFLTDLGKMDGFIHVVRAFQNPEVPHPEGTVDPDRDIGTMDLELAFADLSLIEKRLDRLETQVRSAKATERDQGEREMALLRRLKEGLESDVPIRAQQLSDEELKAIETYKFLTQKPLLVLLNIGEEDLPRQDEIEREYREKYAGPHKEVAAFCGKLEMDLLELSEEEAAEYRRELGIGEETGLDKAVRLSYHLLGLLSFFTVGPDECRAWTVRQGATAPEAAGKIHSDLQRGFIRAEVIRWDDLLRVGSLAEAKKQGILRLEGKGYVVQDGDVMHVLFNV